MMGYLVRMGDGVGLDVNLVSMLEEGVLELMTIGDIDTCVFFLCFSRNCFKDSTWFQFSFDFSISLSASSSCFVFLLKEALLVL